MNMSGGGKDPETDVMQNEQFNVIEACSSGDDEICSTNKKPESSAKIEDGGDTAMKYAESLDDVTVSIYDGMVVMDEDTSEAAPGDAMNVVDEDVTGEKDPQQVAVQSGGTGDAAAASADLAASNMTAAQAEKAVVTPAPRKTVSCDFEVIDAEEEQPSPSEASGKASTNPTTVKSADFTEGPPPAVPFVDPMAEQPHTPTMDEAPIDELLQKTADPASEILEMDHKKNPVPATKTPDDEKSSKCVSLKSGNMKADESKLDLSVRVNPEEDVPNEEMDNLDEWETLDEEVEDEEKPPVTEQHSLDTWLTENGFDAVDDWVASDEVAEDSPAKKAKVAGGQPDGRSSKSTARLARDPMKKSSAVATASKSSTTSSSRQRASGGRSGVKNNRSSSSRKSSRSGGRDSSSKHPSSSAAKSSSSRSATTRGSSSVRKPADAKRSPRRGGEKSMRDNSEKQDTSSRRNSDAKPSIKSSSAAGSKKPETTSKKPSQAAASSKPGSTARDSAIKPLFDASQKSSNISKPSPKPLLGEPKGSHPVFAKKPSDSGKREEDRKSDASHRKRTSVSDLKSPRSADSSSTKNNNRTVVSSGKGALSISVSNVDKNSATPKKNTDDNLNDPKPRDLHERSNRAREEPKTSKTETRHDKPREQHHGSSDHDSKDRSRSTHDQHRREERERKPATGAKRKVDEADHDGKSKDEPEPKHRRDPCRGDGSGSGGHRDSLKPADGRGSAKGIVEGGGRQGGPADRGSGDKALPHRSPPPPDRKADRSGPGVPLDKNGASSISDAKCVKKDSGARTQGKGAVPEEESKGHHQKSNQAKKEAEKKPVAVPPRHSDSKTCKATTTTHSNTAAGDKKPETKTTESKKSVVKPTLPVSGKPPPKSSARPSVEPPPEILQYVNSLVELEYEAKKYTWFYCVPCQDTLAKTAAWEEHITETEHRRKAAIWRECREFLSLERSSNRTASKQAVVDGSRELVTGADYIMEITEPVTGFPDQWVCFLCNEICDTADRLTAHLNSFAHLDNHMERVRPEIYAPPFILGESETHCVGEDRVRKAGAEYMKTNGRGKIRAHKGSKFEVPLETGPDQLDFEEVMVKQQMEQLFESIDNSFVPNYRQLDTDSSVVNKYLLKNPRASRKPSTIVGQQYMVEFWAPSRRCFPAYYCILCDYVSVDFLTHCSAMKHTILYFLKHYASVYDCIIHSGIKTQSDVRKGLEVAKGRIMALEGWLEKVNLVVELQEDKEVFVAMNSDIAKMIIKSLDFKVAEPQRKKVPGVASNPTDVAPRKPLPAPIPDSDDKSRPQRSSGGNGRSDFKESSTTKPVASVKGRHYRSKDEDEVEIVGESHGVHRSAENHVTENLSAAKALITASCGTNNRQSLNAATTMLPKEWPKKDEPTRIASVYERLPTHNARVDSVDRAPAAHRGHDGPTPDKPKVVTLFKSTASPRIDVSPAGRKEPPPKKFVSPREPLSRQHHHNYSRPGPPHDDRGGGRGRGDDRRHQHRGYAGRGSPGPPPNSGHPRFPPRHHNEVGVAGGEELLQRTSWTRGRNHSGGGGEEGGRGGDRDRRIRHGSGAGVRSRSRSPRGASFINKVLVSATAASRGSKPERSLSARDLERLEVALRAVNVDLGRPLTTGDLAMLRLRLGDSLVDKLLDQVCGAPLDDPKRGGGGPASVVTIPAAINFAGALAGSPVTMAPIPLFGATGPPGIQAPPPNLAVPPPIPVQHPIPISAAALVASRMSFHPVHNVVAHHQPGGRGGAISPPPGILSPPMGAVSMLPMPSEPSSVFASQQPSVFSGAAGNGDPHPIKNAAVQQDSRIHNSHVGDPHMMSSGRRSGVSREDPGAHRGSSIPMKEHLKIPPWADMIPRSPIGAARPPSGHDPPPGSNVRGDRPPANANHRSRAPAREPENHHPSGPRSGSATGRDGRKMPHRSPSPPRKIARPIHHQSSVIDGAQGATHQRGEPIRVTLDRERRERGLAPGPTPTVPPPPYGHHNHNTGHHRAGFGEKGDFFPPRYPEQQTRGHRGGGPPDRGSRQLGPGVTRAPYDQAPPDPRDSRPPLPAAPRNRYEHPPPPLGTHPHPQSSSNKPPFSGGGHPGRGRGGSDGHRPAPQFGSHRGRGQHPNLGRGARGGFHQPARGRIADTRGHRR